MLFNGRIGPVFTSDSGKRNRLNPQADSSEFQGQGPQAATPSGIKGEPQWDGPASHGGDNRGSSSGGAAAALQSSGGEAASGSTCGDLGDAAQSCPES